MGIKLMPKMPDCSHCLLYACNPYLVCTVYPEGVEDSSCIGVEPRYGAK
ncbi:hypothetical protein I4641_21060 [Waterburya agarophytonicola K14]|uniref:Uncharacterized protein n=1 Tax=Waterburya agarophytonicola KI4 TaxID=2874699 RepID=A0A964BWI7_9CYAN|nr:hypothetical protein [Waterburya agarophytonicola]MCC0179453.1 hypothetical protein [Waterburya agarophytonicola KI4]